jgi:hypothetical protein
LILFAAIFFLYPNCSTLRLIFHAFLAWPWPGVKGGIEDFVVIDEIDIAALRIFQKDHRSPPEGPFKPVPDGFKLYSSRKSSSGTGKKVQKMATRDKYR